MNRARKRQSPRRSTGLAGIGKSKDEALTVLAAYRPRYAKVAELAGLADEFRAAGKVKVGERVAGTDMTDFYTLSFKRTAGTSRR